jgi:hypothetical protein
MKTIFKKSLLLSMVGLLLVELVIPLLASGKAQAAVLTGAWVDSATIIIGSAAGAHATYKLDSASGNYIYSPKNPGGSVPSGCDPTHITNSPPCTCPNTISIIQVAVPANSLGKIEENHWVKTNPPCLHHGISRYKCESLSGGAPNSDPAHDIALTDTDNAALAPGSGASSSKDIGCTAQLTSALSWLLCAAIDVLSQVVNWIDSLITNQLNIKTSAIFCTSGPDVDTCTAYYQAWQSFRDIGLGLMAIAGLVLIISQALGLEILDAYTIRKTLPRLLVAAFAITLSWPIMRFLIQLSDDLGFGVRHLIYAPFSNLGDSVDLSFGGGIGNLFGAAIGSVGLIGLVPAWIIGGGPGALLAFMGTAALAVGVAILVLILRQVAVILLMLLAPLALVAYILPNTQRVYRMWWESFSKALLMFPLIAAMIATGRVFSAIAIHNGGVLNSIIGFAAYFAPYFMIPLTFRMAGSAVGAMGNFVNGRAQGGFDSLRNARKEERAKRTKAAQKHSMYREGLRPFKYPTLRKDPATGKRKWKEGSLDKMLNTIADNTVDWKDGWRLQAAKKGGRVGRALMGRQARGLMDDIYKERIEHTKKGGQILHGKYHTARAVMGDLGYHVKGLKDRDKELGLTGKTAAEGSAYAALVDNFGIKTGGKDADGHDSVSGWRGTRNEDEDYKMASILDHGDPASQFAATELRSSALTMNRMRGPGKAEETGRFDRGLWGMMVAAEGGRLENSQLVGYYNRQAEAGHGDEAFLRDKELRALAEPKRGSQSETYGAKYIDAVTKDGKHYKKAVDVYEHPLSESAQDSEGRMTSQDYVGKKEDLIDPEGDLSGHAQALIARASHYEMEEIPLTRMEEETDPQTKEKKMVRKTVIDPRTGNAKTMVRPKVISAKPVVRIKDGKQVVVGYRPEYKMKDEKGHREADASRGIIQSIQGYAQGDSGFGGAIYQIMHETALSPKWAAPDVQQAPGVQARELPPRQPPQPPPAPAPEEPPPS